jgi:hypothetical protein
MNSTSRTRVRSLAVLVAALGALAGVAGAAETTLTNGVASHRALRLAGVGCHFRIDVPAGRGYALEISVGRHRRCRPLCQEGSPPTTTSYDYHHTVAITKPSM